MDSVESALEKVIVRGGGIITFAKAMGVTHQAVSAWRKRGYMPFDRAAVAETLFGVPRERLVSPRMAAAYLTARSVDVL